MTLLYSFDSSALIEGWHRRLPPDVVPSFWRKLEALVEAGEVACIDEVKKELDKKTDDLLSWVQGRKGLVHPMTPEVFSAAQAIIRQFPGMVKPGRDRDRADPFVVALAQVEQATVVTEERLSPSRSNPKIPDVCSALGIQCINVYGFVRAQGWQF